MPSILFADVVGDGHLKIGRPGATGVSLASDGVVGNAVRTTTRVSFDTQNDDNQLAWAGGDTSTGNVTVCAWLRPGASYHKIQFDYSGGVNNEAFFEIDFNTKTINGDIWNFHTGSHGYAFRSGSSIVPNIDGNWHFFIGEVRNGVCGFQFDNGTVDTGNPPDSQPMDNGASFEPTTVGFMIITTAASPDTPTQTIDVDEVCIFRRALTDDEKTFLWNSGHGKTWPLT